MYAISVKMTKGREGGKQKKREEGKKEGRKKEKKRNRKGEWVERNESFVFIKHNHFSKNCLYEPFTPSCKTFDPFFLILIVCLCLHSDGLPFDVKFIKLLYQTKVNVSQEKFLHQLMIVKLT